MSSLLNAISLVLIPICLLAPGSETTQQPTFLAGDTFHTSQRAMCPSHWGIFLTESLVCLTKDVTEILPQSYLSVEIKKEAGHMIVHLHNCFDKLKGV